MANIGWFILIYLVVGWVLDVILTIGLLIIAAYKDQKNGNNCCMDGTNEYLEEMQEAANAIDDSGKGYFKAWLIGRLTWPWALPYGVNRIWEAIKASEVKKEES